jgi:hypothetical protein
LTVYDQASYPHPLGVSFVDGGVNVALYSTVAESVAFCTSTPPATRPRVR